MIRCNRAQEIGRPLILVPTFSGRQPQRTYSYFPAQCLFEAEHLVHDLRDISDCAPAASALFLQSGHLSHRHLSAVIGDYIGAGFAE